MDLSQLLLFANSFVLVEGVSDKRALEEIGFSQVQFLSGPLFSVVESFEKGCVVQLCFDNDAHGRELTKRFTREFSQRGVQVRFDVQNIIFSFGVTRIEDFLSFVRRRK